MDFLARVKSQLDWSDSLREMWVESFRDELDDEGRKNLEDLEKAHQETTRRYIQIITNYETLVHLERRL